MPTKPLAFVILLTVAFGGCQENRSSSDDTSANVDSSEDCNATEPENPYDDGSGHYAGFAWAEQNDPGSCGGNSSSFIEGCEEFLRQSEAYEACAAR